MTDLALARVLERSELLEFFARVLPDVRVRVEESTPELPLDWDVRVSLEVNASEFPFGLIVLAAMQPGRDFELWLCCLARTMSEYFAVRAICDGTRFGDSAAPYWSIVWDCGAPLLADDSNTTYGDGEGGPVRIIRPLNRDEMALPTSPELADWVRRSSSAARPDE